MKIEIKNEHEEFNQLVPILAKIFIQRWDLYARQLDNGSYVCIKKQLRFDHLRDHLRGKITLGAYVLDQKSNAKYIVFDADDDDQFKRLAIMAFQLTKRKVPSYLETSARGGHLWLFFPMSIPGKKARRFGNELARIHKLTNVELFPKQDKLDNGPDSLIRLPFGMHRKTGECYDFIGPDHKPMAAPLVDKVKLFCALETVPEAALEAMLPQASNRSKTTVSKAVDESEMPISERIKDSISVYDFVGQYVELSPSGRGLCPFHDDRHTSFSVNVEDNYWNCFAGCGGGSIIDFWIMRENCSFNEAIKKLAYILL